MIETVSFTTIQWIDEVARELRSKLDRVNKARLQAIEKPGTGLDECDSFSINHTMESDYVGCKIHLTISER